MNEYDVTRAAKTALGKCSKSKLGLGMGFSSKDYFDGTTYSGKKLSYFISVLISWFVVVFDIQNEIPREKNASAASEI